MEKKGTVLIISYHYLPEVMAASSRIHAWAKYLPGFGWKPIILTRQIKRACSAEVSTGLYQELDEAIKCKVYRAAFDQSFKNIWNLRQKLTEKEDSNFIDISMRKTLSFALRNFLLIPDEKAGWYRPAYKAGLSIIRRYPIDIILSTGAPWTDFKIASRLSRTTGIPWVADYRDPWTQRTTMGVQKEYVIWFMISRFYEKMIARTASDFIQVTESYKEGLSKTIGCEVHLIRNGFDPAGFEKCSEYVPNKQLFTVSFIGTLHPNTKTEVFLQGFRTFVFEHSISPKKFRIQFIGDTRGHKNIEKTYDRFYEIAEFFCFIPPMPQYKANQMMCSSHILLLFPLDMEGHVPAKTYEYLASGRPILVSPGGCYRKEIRDVLARTGGGVILDSPEEVARWIGSKYEEFRRTGYVASDTNREAVEEFSRKRQVRFLASILDKATAGSS